MRKAGVVLTALFLSLSLLLSACNSGATKQQDPAAPGPNGTDKKEFVVGYSAAGLIDELQVTWSNGVKGAVEAAGGKVLIVDSQNKIQKQVADIEDLLAKGISVLVVNPVDEQGIVPAIEAANKKNIPVITIDRAAAGGTVSVHVGFDNYKAGYDAGVYIADRNGKKGKVIQIEGQAGTSVARERSQGFVDAIAKYPDMKIVAAKPADWDTAKAQAFVEDALVNNPDTVGIWAHADAMIMGAVQALKGAKKLDKVITVGMGMYGGGPESIAANELTASWELFPDQLGKLAGEAAVKINKGESVPKTISTDMVMATKENISQYLKK